MIFDIKQLRFILTRITRSQSRPAPALCISQTKKMSTCNDIEANYTDILWMDIEMTGLDINKDKILEVACIITDKDLNVKSEGPCFAVNHEPHVYDNMNEWCVKSHNESGLVERCKKSDVTPEMAEGIILSYLKKNLPKRHCPLAGNSVYMDRLFIRKFYPAVDEYLHYRIIDVSTIKELAGRWNPELFSAAPPKKMAHRSLDDIKESISELKYYKKHMFK